MKLVVEVRDPLGSLFGEPVTVNVPEVKAWVKTNHSLSGDGRVEVRVMIRGVEDDD